MERETGIEPATSSLGIVLETLYPLVLEGFQCATTRKIAQNNALSAPYPHPGFVSSTDQKRWTSLAYVKDQLGHSSIRMTVDVYGHLVPGANRQAVNKLPSLDDSKPIEPSSKQARN